MNRKILKYELKRIVFSKIFLFTSIFAVLYTIVDLYTNIIQGVSGTAPFSQWSYCKFLCDLNLITLTIFMLSCTDLFSQKEKKVNEITSCMAISPKKYLANKCFALFLSYCIVEAFCVLISFLFYKTTFHYTDFQDYLLPLCVILIPSFSFVIGSSMLFGSKRQGLLYAWIPVYICMSLLTFHHGLFQEISCKSYMTNMPVILPVNSIGEANFYLSNAFVSFRILLTLLGLFLFVISFFKTIKKTINSNIHKFDRSTNPRLPGR